jgi:Flp pilus assembly protein TadD
MKSLFIVNTLVLGLVFLQVQAFAALPSAAPENPHLVAARDEIRAKDFNRAVADLEQAVQENPKDADAHTMLAYSYRKLGAFEKSMDDYQKALKIDANHRSTHEYLGELYLDINQPDNAERQLQALKKTCPLLGKCSEYNDLKHAIDNYHKAKNSRSPA